MNRRHLSQGLAAAAVAAVHLWGVAHAEERMQLGVPAGSAGEFRHLIGDRVFFSEGSAEIGARARKALEAQADWLKRHPTLWVTIEGHADDPGAREQNLSISLRRAEAVRQRLVEGGVAPQRIRLAAYGKERAIAVCPSPLCAAQNRRAVTIIGREDTALEPAVPAPEPRPQRRLR
jgi:outer membrane protein OmpA-like peptidoglycan-associated protein